MNAAMKPAIFTCFAILLISCNMPLSPATAESDPVQSGTVSPTLQPTIVPPLSTSSPIPPSPTSTPIPCDPLTADYCISDGHFLFQRPIQPPGNDSVDLTYLYASTSNGKRDAHHGVEFQNAFGTQVHAAGDGVVAFADADRTVKFSPWNDFYGNAVIIRHQDEMYTLYAHLSAIMVQAGNQVKAGDVIGQVGATGGATGPHLHFEVRAGSDYEEYFSTENPVLWFIPQPGSGAISITLKTQSENNYEHPLVVMRLADGSDDALFTYYIKSYARGFEHNAEDAALDNLPAGRYKIALNDSSGLKERIVFVEAGRLTEVFFEVK
jgi:murein DD-endopeptidase MepM/ murein hydrolase activator NlpD